MRCDEARLSLGVYLLDALEADPRAQVEAHLWECSRCTAELSELAALPGLLGLLTAQEAEDGSPTASPDGFERLLAKARTQADAPRSDRRLPNPRRVGLVAAAAALLLAAAGLGLARWESTPTPPHAYTAAAGPVRMTVLLTAEVRGTALDVTVRGLPAGERCTLVAVARDGTRQTVGTWQATYGGQAWSKAAMSIPQAQLAQLVLLGENGSTLVTLGL